MMPTQFTYRPLALLLATAFCSPVAANAQDNTTLDTVEVIGQAESTVVDRDTLDKKQSKNIRDIFEDTSSVNLSRNSRGQIGDVEIRGMGGFSNTFAAGSNRVTMEVDGMDISQGFNFGHNMNFGRDYLDPADLKSISVQKGPSASGLAGSIRFRTKDPKDYLLEGQKVTTELRAGYRSDEEAHQVGATIAGKLSDTVSAMLSYTRRGFHELDNAGGLDVIGAKRTANNPSDNTSDAVNGKIVVRPNAQHRFTFNAQYFNTERENIIASGLGRTVSRGSTYDYTKRTTEQENTRTAFSLRHDISQATALFDNASWQLSNQNTKSRSFDYTAFSLTTPAGKTSKHYQSDDNNFKIHNLAFRADFDKSLQAGNTRHDLSYGLRLQRSVSELGIMRVRPNIRKGGVNSSQLEYFPETTRTMARLHFADRMSFGDSGFSITPSIHVNYISTDPKTQHKQAIEGTKKVSDTSLGGGLRFDYLINQANLLSLDLHHTARLPGFGEVGAQSYGHWLSKPNPNLKQETSDAAELTWRSRGDWGHQKTAVFYNQYNDLINSNCVGWGDPDSYCELYNSDGKTKIYGVEWDGTLNLSVFNLPKGLALSGSLAYLKGKDGNGDPHEEIDPFNGYVSLRYDNPADTWGAEGKVRFAAAKKRSDLKAKTPELAGWATFDLTAYVTPSKNLSISGGVYNVFDKTYARWDRARWQPSVDRYTEAGRHFGINVRYKF